MGDEENTEIFPAKPGDKITREKMLEWLFPDTVFVGFGHMTPDGRIVTHTVHDQPEFASVSVFIPKDKLEEFKKYDREHRDKETQRGPDQS